ncbi:hypothetical protein AB1Y20_022974 [Prymnesium parvum]|uniref:J domain-containing protein n=1 Tax=Prymnesium parvum TaxID=97485 RepID=A0AB34JE21_PRYPA
MAVRVVSSVAELVGVSCELSAQLGLSLVLPDHTPLSHLLEGDARSRLEAQPLQSAVRPFGRVGEVFGGLWRRRGSTGPPETPSTDPSKPPAALLDVETEMGRVESVGSLRDRAGHADESETLSLIDCISRLALVSQCNLERGRAAPVGSPSACASPRAAGGARLAAAPLAAPHAAPLAAPHAAAATEAGDSEEDEAPARQRGGETAAATPPHARRAASPLPSPFLVSPPLASPPLASASPPLPSEAGCASPPPPRTRERSVSSIFMPTPDASDDEALPFAPHDEAYAAAARLPAFQLPPLSPLRRPSFNSPHLPQFSPRCLPSLGGGAVPSLPLPPAAFVSAAEEYLGELEAMEAREAASLKKPATKIDTSWLEEAPVAAAAAALPRQADPEGKQKAAGVMEEAVEALRTPAAKVEAAAALRAAGRKEEAAAASLGAGMKQEAAATSTAAGRKEEAAAASLGAGMKEEAEEALRTRGLNDEAVAASKAAGMLEEALEPSRTMVMKTEVETSRTMGMTEEAVEASRGLNEKAAEAARAVGLNDEAVDAFLESAARARSEELRHVGALASASRQLAALLRKEQQRVQLAMQQAERVAQLHNAWWHQQREHERQHTLQQRASAVVDQWVQLHGPRLRDLLSALDYPPLVELLPLCAECKVSFPPGADSAHVRRSYLHTIRRIHPDKLQGSKLRERTAASAIFEALRQATER